MFKISNNKFIYSFFYCCLFIGGFAQAAIEFDTTIPSNGDRPVGITKGDFNNDGILDLVVTNFFSDTISIHLGNGTGEFLAVLPTLLSRGDAPRAVTPGDFNSDGNLDFAVVNAASHTVVIFMGNGSGSFVAAIPGIDSEGTGPVSITSLDFDNDGDIDLAIPNGNENTIVILENDGTGNFVAGLPFISGDLSTSSPSTSRLPSAITSGDFNNDGIPDLAVTNQNAQNVGIHLGNGTPVFSPVPSIVNGSERGPISITSGDFDTDGNLDLFVVYFSTDHVAILKGDGTGGFSVDSNIMTADQPRATVSGDFDNNGILDFAYTVQSSGTVETLLGDGMGGFVSGPSNSSGGAIPIFMTNGDFDNDGITDLAVVNFNSNNIGILRTNIILQPEGSPVIDTLVPNLNEPLPLGESVIMTAEFTNANDIDLHTCVFDWDDGSSDMVVANDTSGSISSSCDAGHTYLDAGVYSVTVTITDDDGESATRFFEFVVVYDLEGGFVTGGGTFESPTGAYVPDPTSTGSASFGFVAKYKKGATVPTGNTEFQHHTVGLNFHSINYDFLVVTNAGMRAQYKGIGTLNGEDGFKFMIWATDGDPDTFRIRIWKEDQSGNETTIYDNGFDQPIDKGSIVIHTKKSK